MFFLNKPLQKCSKVEHDIEHPMDIHLATVQYSKFDNVISIIQTLGEHAKIGQIDIKSAF
jgi:hypothetical protein